MSIKRISLFVFFLAGLVLLTYQHGKANIGLLSFTATAQDNSILIEWVTETELDNAGFVIRRSEHPVLNFEDYSPFILARGSAAGGATYEFLDEDVTDGITYYYMLQAWDINNSYENFGPVSATIGGTPTHTPTLTPNTSRTPTRTLRPSDTARPTTTSNPANTFTPVPPTLTATPITETPTITPTATITPSPTLFDPPEIVIEVPATTASTPTRVPTATQQPTPTPTQTPDNILAKMIKSGSLLTIGAICLVVLIWAAIAVATFIYLQKRNA